MGMDGGGRPREGKELREGARVRVGVRGRESEGGCGEGEREGIAQVEGEADCGVCSIWRALGHTSLRPLGGSGGGETLFAEKTNDWLTLDTVSNLVDNADRSRIGQKSAREV